MNSPRMERRCQRLALLLVAWIMLAVSGCASSEWIRLRQVPQSPLTQPLQLLSWKGPQATPRTMQLLRRYDLTDRLARDETKLLAEFQDYVLRDPSADHVYALAELSFLSGVRAESSGDYQRATDMYGSAVGNAYIFLLDEQFDWERNPYDPQFRRACDLYNTALERVLRMLRRDGRLHLGESIDIETSSQTFHVRVVNQGEAATREFAYFEFVSDYELKGLSNIYRTYGLGVPLIGVHKERSATDRVGSFYPPGLSSPVTAFLRVLPGSGEHVDPTSRKHACVLEINDSQTKQETRVHGRLVPLETDLSTPLAYALNNPFFEQADNATSGLLNLRTARAVAGLYMLQEFDPNKIPVLMVHGLWSSLTTWMEMFNDLQGSDALRDNYQFWFYQYPTGQQFWISAAELRRQLTTMRERVDPEHQSEALDNIVIVAHSMGGLVAGMQVVESEDRFWNLVSDERLDDMDVPDRVKDYLRDALYFSPNKSIRRVVTIATPHRGSELSNSATQWLGRRLIKLPEEHRQAQVILQEREARLASANLLGVETSIEALAPNSPILPVLLAARQDSSALFHNVVGRLQDERVLRRVTGDGDGVVSFDSAHVDGVESEIVVKGKHVDIHRHPRTVLEIRRILLEHLALVGRDVPHRLPPIWRVVERPTSVTSATSSNVR